MGCSTISGTVDGFSAVATEATTLNWFVFLTVKMEPLPKTHDPLDELLRVLGAKSKEEEVEAGDLALGIENLGEARLCAIFAINYEVVVRIGDQKIQKIEKKMKIETLVKFEGVERGSESDKLDSGGIGGVSEYSAPDNVSGTDDSVCNKENECVAVAKSMLSAAEISDGVNFVKPLASARFTHRCVSEKFH
ncbi:hypothetical protein SASPL_112227 [Salvia splendens]|uniref:Uncharacterized protein n=1 Tax=Salvia splendens TaxID=180675 RepID=A0A8X9A5W1_SALSN|nr:hypothetical protein SASPL_112227 [Salvia splendens]